MLCITAKMNFTHKNLTLVSSDYNSSVPFILQYIQNTFKIPQDGQVLAYFFSFIFGQLLIPLDIFALTILNYLQFFYYAPLSCFRALHPSLFLILKQKKV